MKKYIKIVLATLLMLCICFSLCSCIELDDLKAQHAVQMSDYEIVLQGKSYIEFADDEIEINMGYDDDEYSYCNVTKENVPVLLSSAQGHTAEINTKKGIILYNGRYYAREDIYPTAKEAVEQKNFTTLYFEYETGLNEEYIPIYERYMFNKSEKNIINNILNSKTFYTDDDIDIYDYKHEFEIYKTDDTDLLLKYECDLYVNSKGTEYYLVRYNYYYNDDSPAIYIVNKKYNDMFKRLAEMNDQYEMGFYQ